MSVFRANNSPDTDWSVPLQRGPYPMEEQDVDTDSPTQRIYAPSEEPEPLAELDEPFLDVPEPHRHRGVVTAVVIAALALMASGGATLIAWQAIERVDGKAMTIPTMPVPTIAPQAAPTMAATTAPGTPGSTAETAPEPTAGASLLYAQEPLQVQVACGGNAQIDLDGQPRLGASEQQSDLRYDNRCGSAGTLFFAGRGARAASHVTDPDLDRPGCADAIDTSPLDSGEGVPVIKGTVLCVAAATTLALVEVTGVAPNGVASLRATGWIAPSASGADATVVPSIGTSPGE